MLGLEFSQRRRVLQQQQPISKTSPCEPSGAAIAHFLSCCGKARDLRGGQHAHDHILRHGLEGRPFLGGLLVQMYGKCDALLEAQSLFLAMPARHVHLWSSMIKSFARIGYADYALDLFHQMHQEAVLPEQATYVCALSACAIHSTLAIGTLIHCRISGSGLLMDLPIGNALVSMYGKYYNMEDAHRTFMHMPQHDVFSWTAIISAYAQCSQGKEAIPCFDQMLEEGVAPNTVTFISLLSAITTPERVQDALDTFNHLPERDIVSWNAVIAACVLHGCSMDAFHLYLEMRHLRVKPNKTTYASLLPACTSQTQGMLMHFFITEVGFELDVFVGTAINSMYGKYGTFEDARAHFFSMDEKNVISWNVMIVIYAQHRKSEEALVLSATMRQQGAMWSNITIVNILDICAQQGWLTEAQRIHSCILGSASEPGIAIGNALINAYGKCSNTDGARREFDNLCSRDVVSWTSMITAYAQDGHGLEALAMFHRMQKEGVLPDEITYLSVLNACASQSKLTDGEYTYSCLIKKGYESDLSLATALMNMYGRCGKLDAAQKIFNSLSCKSVVSWTVIIAAHAYHGQGKEALQLFKQMSQEFVPDNATYLSILSACSHAGLVDEGNFFLACMREEYNGPHVLDHYGCLIDLHGRAGRLDDAETLIKGMAEHPSIESCMALLSACKHREDVDCAERTSKHLLISDTKCSSVYVMLSNIYATSGKLDDAMTLARKNEVSANGENSMEV